MARVAVTGATGMVGGRVVRRLVARGDDVVALVRRPDDALAALGVRQVTGDLAELGSTAGELLEGAAGAVHLGAAVSAAALGVTMEQGRAVNHDGTRALVDAALRTGARLVNVSTGAIYDREAAGELIVESSPLKASGDPYALTKIAAEQEVARGVEQGLSAMTLRPPAILGTGPTSVWGTRIPEMVRDGTVPVRPFATTLAWIHADDLADVLVAAVEADAQEVVNAVGGHTTWGDYVERVRALFPGAPPVADPPGEAWTGRFATDRLPAVLGVEPRRTLDEAFEEIAAWWR